MKVNEKLSVLFLLENAKKTKFGLVPLTVRLTIDGLRTELSLGKKLLPEFWDQDRSRVILKGNPNVKQAQLVNSAIVQCLAELERQYLRLNEKCDSVSVELLKKSYKRAIGRKNPETENQESKEKTICQVCNYKYSKFAVLVKNGHRSSNTLKRWRSTKRKIREFLKFKFNKWDIPLSTLRYSHANDFLHFLLTKHGIEENTSRKYLKNTKELLQIAEDQQWIPKNLWNNYKIGYDQPERECLSLHEIIRLHEKTLIERLDHVRNIFLFACFTGYAFQEVLSLTPEDIFIGIDGKNWIKIDRKKTGRPECIPLLPIPASIVSRYANDPYCLSYHKLLPLKSYQNYNGYLKEVACIKACQEGKSVLFTSIPKMLTQIRECHSSRTLRALELKFEKYDLVICDELGYISFDKPGAEMLFNHISLRTGIKSTIITSNKSFDKWNEIFGMDTVLTAALLDRLTHKSHLIDMNGKSYRMKETKNMMDPKKRKR